MTNLHDDYASLITIVETHTIYAIGFIYISKVSLVILIGISANRRQNFLVSLCRILMDEIFEFLVIFMTLDTVLMNILKEHCNIIQVYINILYILAIVILFDDSIDFLVFVATTTIYIAWKIIKTRMIQFGGFNFLVASGYVAIYS